jgi:hypothetical protein
MMLDADPGKRVKADFFIELYAVRNDREVNKFSWFSKDRFTDDMLTKVEQKGIKIRNRECAAKHFRLELSY